MIMISNFLFSSINFCVIVNFLTKLPTLGIVFSTAVGAPVVDKSVILGISPLTSFILALREASLTKLVILGISLLTSFLLALRVVLVAKLVISVILSSIFFILALYTSFLTTLHYLIYLNHKEQVLVYQHPIFLIYF